jgi:ABC-type multidrug transport system fused ATPase/permease subunit
MPAADLKAEELMSRALGPSPATFDRCKEAVGGMYSQNVDSSITGVFKTVVQLAKFSIELSPQLTAAAVTLSCFSSLQGLATGKLVSWIQSTSDMPLAGMFALSAAGVAISSVIFMTSSLSQFNHERFGWVAQIYFSKKLDRAVIAQAFEDRDSEELHATIAEVRQHQIRLNSLLFGLSNGIAGLVGVTLSYVTMAQHYPLLALGMVLAVMPRFVVDYFLAPYVADREREQAARHKRIDAAGRLITEAEAAREFQMLDQMDWAQCRRDGVLDASRVGRFNIHRDIFWRQMFGSSTLFVTGVLATVFPILDFMTESISAQALPAAIGSGISLATSAFLVSSFWGQMLTNRIFLQRILNFFERGERASVTLGQAEGVARRRFAGPLYTLGQDSTIRFEAIRVCPPGTDLPILAFDELVLKPGKVVGIVGENGQGKSTLLNLLTKQIKPSAGKIYLCNVKGRGGEFIPQVDITQCDTEEWLGMVSRLYQDYPRMFGLTVDQAICLGGHPSGDTAAVRRAHEIVQLDAKLAGKVNGRQTVIGRQEGGVTLSGGEGQAVALARTLSFGEDRPIIMLDEPGAACDPRNESRMLVGIKQMARDPRNPKIVILVSHRYGSICDADEILVIHRHTIAERGTHDELMRAEGIYYGAWREQVESLLGNGRIALDAQGNPVIINGKKTDDSLE